MEAHPRFSDLPAADQASRQLLDGVGLLLIRMAAGGFMLPHGLGKLFGWFNGPGLAGFAVELQGFGLPASAPLPLLLALVQTGLGASVVAGAWTRWSALFASLFLSMTVVLSASSGWFWMHRGMEYPLLWTLVLFALSLTGAGPLSVDHILGHRIMESDAGIPDDG
jgi:putative oxidoreductase